MNRHRHSIYYSSDAYTWLHTDNKQSSFKNNINSESLNYLPSGPLEVALVNLTITLKQKIQKGSKALQLGVRSTLQKDISIRGSGYDNIIYTFTILPSSKRTINYEIPTTQHIYLQTTRANLEKAAFQIINLEDNKLFSEIDYSPNATFLEVTVQPHTMTSNAMILSSNDPSCIRNCANKNMNFTTYLPEQLSYQGQTWAVVCKGLQTTGKFWNVQDDTFTVKYIKEKEEEEEEEEELSPAKKLKKNRISISNEQVVSYIIGLQKSTSIFNIRGQYKSTPIPAGEYDNIEKLVQALNNSLQSLIGSELVKIEFKSTTDGKMLLELGFVLDDDSRTSEVILTIPSELSRILGYSDSYEQKQFQCNMNNTTVTFQSDYTYQNYEPTAVAATTVEEQMDTAAATSSSSSSSSSFEETTIILEQGYYRTRLEVVEWLNKELKAHGIETASFDITRSQVTGKLSAATKIIIPRNTFTNNKESLILSPKLAKMLGFTNDTRQQYSVDLGVFNSNPVSQYAEDLNVGLPSNLLVNMDVVETRVVGDKHLPVIQAIYIGHQGGEGHPAICHFVFRENNPVLLDTKLFSKVKITITDINGVPVKAEQDCPTIIHLSFVKYG